MKYGLIGGKLGHSFSRELHAKIADYEYELQELAPGELGPFLQARDFCGINVTIPYKQAVIPYLDGLSERARRIGAVNTIINRGGRLWGENTDYWGLRALLERLTVTVAGKKVLILGTGGTAHTAKTVLEDLGASDIVQVSRSKKNGAVTYEQLSSGQMQGELLLNTTPVGMAGFCRVTEAKHTIGSEGYYFDLAADNDFSRPADLRNIPGLQGVVDVIYNPLRTDLVLQARQLGLPAAGGLYMLAGQAVYASALFRNVVAGRRVTDRVYQEFLYDKENLVLIGMPGCGKSTLGAALAPRLGKRFIDTDEVLQNQLGCSPGDYIRCQGEAAFRQAETAVIDRISGEHSCVIATGGGAVLADRNVRKLRHNGRLYFLDRSLERLAVSSDRPLSASPQQLQALYAQRRPHYLEVADVVVAADGSVEQVINGILGGR